MTTEPVTSEDPATGQSEATVGAYLQGCAVGDAVAIHETEDGWLKVTLTAVSATNARLGRVYTADRGLPGAAWHRRTGRSCWHPKGTSRLVEPTEAVRRFATERPLGGRPEGGTVCLYGTDAPVRA